MHPITPRASEDSILEEESGAEDLPSYKEVTLRKTAFIYGARSRTFLSGSPYYFARALEAYGRLHGTFELVDFPPRRGREILFDSLKWLLASRTSRTDLFRLSQGYHDASGRGALEVAAEVSALLLCFCAVHSSQYPSLPPRAPGCTHHCLSRCDAFRPV